MIGFRSFLFNVWFYVTLTVELLALLVLLPFPPLAMSRGVRLWCHVVQFGMRWIVGLAYEIRGLENVPDGPILIASKHQSVWDTTIFHILFDEPAYVMKKELISIPLWGWYAKKCGAVPVDRSAGASALRLMMQGAKRAVAAGNPVIIFPEGTRTAPGSKVAYHPGVAALYGQLGVSVVPVALNSGVFWGRHSFLKKPGRIVLEFLPPLAPGLDRRVFMTELESRIEAASGRLLAEANQTSA